MGVDNITWECDYDRNAAEQLLRRRIEAMKAARELSRGVAARTRIDVACELNPAARPRSKSLSRIEVARDFISTDVGPLAPCGATNEVRQPHSLPEVRRTKSGNPTRSL
ncbi:hypothetical protein, partial [Gordonia alkanivorans]